MQILTPQGYLPEIAPDDLIGGRPLEADGEKYQPPQQLQNNLPNEEYATAQPQQQDQPQQQVQQQQAQQQQSQQQQAQQQHAQLQQAQQQQAQQQQLTFRATRLQPVSGTLLLSDAAAQQLVLSSSNSHPHVLLRPSGDSSSNSGGGNSGDGLLDGGPLLLLVPTESRSAKPSSGLIQPIREAGSHR
jgi:multidrug efflux pump subunit AcrA (membrane-fusion protein)